MKKSILNLGTALNKAEQKKVNGGRQLSYQPNTLNCDLKGGICILSDTIFGVFVRYCCDDGVPTSPLDKNPTIPNPQ